MTRWPDGLRWDDCRPAASQKLQQFIQGFLDAGVRITGAVEFNRVDSPEARLFGNLHRLGEVVRRLRSARVELEALGVTHGWGVGEEYLQSLLARGFIGKVGEVRQRADAPEAGQLEEVHQFFRMLGE